MKLAKQIMILAALVGLFAAADIYIYFICTKRLMTDDGTERRTSSIEVSDYLPFDENSNIVNIKDTLPLTGELPVIDGAEGLYPVYSAFVNAVYPEGSVEFDGSDFTPESKLQMRNTLKAYKGVVDGNADIAVCAAPSAEQLSYAEEMGAELEFVPIGRDAFVFMVNSANPVDSLTANEIREIYSGKYKNWSKLGGEKLPINPLQRLAGSGSQSVFLKFMNGLETVPNYSGWRGSPIGFSFRYYVTGMRENDGVKILSLNGVYPDKESISKGEYPICVDFYAVYDRRNTNPNIPTLIDWFLSENGQRIIEETGYVPIK
ncbi:MAG: substrate-binding domain-containing protein [Oscillospiraceae bacterium]|nr:substrate-binding domain-containing protein [Oscillospiraceae bacterium]